MDFIPYQKLNHLVKFKVNLVVDLLTMQPP